MLGRFFKKSVHVISYKYVRTMEQLTEWEPFGYQLGAWISGGWHNIDEVSDYLFISSIPMRDTEQTIKEDVAAKSGPLTLVVSVIEDYENSETLPFMDPTREEEWRKRFHVDQCQVNMEDFSGGNGLSLDTAAKAVIKIQIHRDQKESVLVHCKAGRTRSAMIAACVIVRFDLANKKENARKSTEQLIDMAVELMQAKRPQIKLHQENKDTAVKIIDRVKATLLVVNELAKKTENNKKSADQLIEMASMQLKTQKDAKESSAKIMDKDAVLRAAEEARSILKARSLWPADTEKLEAKPVADKSDAKPAASVVSASLASAARPASAAQPASSSLRQRVDGLFTNPNLNFIHMITELESYENLVKYRAQLLKDHVFKQPMRAMHVDDILNSIDGAKDGAWLVDLINKTGPVDNLVSASPTFVKDKILEKKIREELVEKLKQDVEKLICINLGCTTNELESIYKKSTEPSHLVAKLSS